MSKRFEELDWRPTPIGAISLRRRREPTLDVDVYEIKLDDDFLMSSLFTVAEIALADLGLAALPGLPESGLPGAGLDVVVGGLGLGYTAQAVLEHSGVRSLIVVDTLSEVIEWHERGLLPVGPRLTSDARCRLVHGDFFAMAATSASTSASESTSAPSGGGAAGFDPDLPGRRFDAILLDIDHSPRQVLHPDNAAFYGVEGLTRLAGHLRPGGVFALWSNDPPDEEFGAVLAEVFTSTRAHVVTFHNHLQDRESTNTVYVAS